MPNWEFRGFRLEFRNHSFRIRKWPFPSSEAYCQQIRNLLLEIYPCEQYFLVFKFGILIGIGIEIGMEIGMN